MTHRIITYNVNGVRAALNKGLLGWLKAADPDMLCLQEVKAHPEQVPVAEFENLGYQVYWYPAEKKGYSGVALFSKQKPEHVEYGCGIKDYDKEGRILRADFKDLSVMSAYFPSGTTGDERQQFKYRFLDDFYEYLCNLQKKYPKLVIGGDFNICHQPIDIHNPVSNANSSGFLPEERKWISKFLDSGFIDSFRHFNKEPHHYTWWTFRANARARNLGWRIDYLMVSNSLEKSLARASILPEAKHSDHCPAFLEMN